MNSYVNIEVDGELVSFAFRLLPSTPESVSPCIVQKWALNPDKPTFAFSVLFQLLVSSCHIKADADFKQICLNQNAVDSLKKTPRCCKMILRDFSYLCLGF